jgi:hypothetical protein
VTVLDRKQPGSSSRSCTYGSLGAGVGSKAMGHASSRSPTKSLASAVRFPFYLILVFSVLTTAPHRMPRSPAEIPTDPLSTTSRALHDTTLRFGTFPLNTSNLSIIFARTKSDLMPTLLVHAVHLRSGRAKGNGVVWEEHTDRIADTGQGACYFIDYLIRFSFSWHHRLQKASAFST